MVGVVEKGRGMAGWCCMSGSRGGGSEEGGDER